MVDMNTLLALQMTIFLLMSAGYLMTKINILPVSIREPLSNLVIDFILPCNIIVSFMMDFSKEMLISCLTIFGISVAIQILSMVIGSCFFSRKNKEQYSMLKYATIVSNAGFLGNPIAQGLYGELGLLYASIYLVPVRVFMWSAGVMCFTGTRGKHVVRKVLTHPCIVAVIIGLLLMIFRIQLPDGIERTLRTAGNCNTALSMIVIGNILAEIKIKDVFDKKAFWYCAVRLLILPAIVLTACSLAGIEPTVRGVSVILVGMPAPASTALLAAKYHGDERFAVKIILLSTLLSLVTIPCLCVLMTVV